MNDDDEMPDLPDNQTATGAEIDARLEQTDRDLADSRAEIERLRESLRLSLAGEHEQAAEILDELDENNATDDVDQAGDDQNHDRPSRTCIDCGREQPTGELIGTEHGPVCRAGCNEDE